MQTSTAGKSADRQGGFTLIELGIVVLLISLFSALTIPMVTGFGENRLDASARRLAGTSKYLFNEAALNKQQYQLVFNLNDGTFGAKVLEPTGELVAVPGRWGSQSLKGDVRFGGVTVAGRGKFTSGEAVTLIHPVGWMEETVIHLEDGDKKLTVRLKPFTGTSEIFDGHREF